MMFEYCKSEAEALGYSTFGVDDKACWSGDAAEDTYDDNGKSIKCPVTFTTGCIRDKHFICLLYTSPSPRDA